MASGVEWNPFGNAWALVLIIIVPAMLIFSIYIYIIYCVRLSVTCTFMNVTSRFLSYLNKSKSKIIYSSRSN